MTSYRFWGLVLVIIFVLGGSGALQAQEQSDVLVISHYGDLWYASGATLDSPQLLSFCGATVSQEQPYSPLIMAPNGDHLVYLNFPAHVSMEEFGISGPPPTVVRLCEGINLQESFLDDQPADFNLTDLNALHYVAHSTPAWSPDSTRVAWTAMDISSTGDRLTLVVFDMATRQAEVIAKTFPPQFGVPVPLQLEWGQNGIAVRSETFNEAISGPEPEILLYAPTGQLLNRLVVPEDETKGFFWDFLFADNSGQEVLVVLYSNGFQDQYDFTTGQWGPLEGVLQVYAPEAPRDSLSVNYALTSSHETAWEVNLLNGDKFRLEYFGLRDDHSLAISPDGQMVVYATDQVYVWHGDGSIETVGLPNPGQIDPNTSLVWSPLAWRIVAGGYG